MVQDVCRYVHDSVDRSTTAPEGTECFSGIGSINSPDFHLHRVPHGPKPPRRRFRNRFPPQPFLVRIAIRHCPRGVLRQQHRRLSPYFQNRFAGRFSLSRFARIRRQMGYPGRCCKPHRFAAFLRQPICRRRSGLPLWVEIKLRRDKVGSYERAVVTVVIPVSDASCPAAQGLASYLPAAVFSGLGALDVNRARSLPFDWRTAGQRLGFTPQPKRHDTMRIGTRTWQVAVTFRLLVLGVGMG